jgi:hypothetical protein
MLSLFWKVVVVAPILTLLALPAMAEQPSRLQLPGTPASSPYSQRPPSLVRSSGYIFAGTVKSVDRVVPKGDAVATVQISFHVDQAMRGVRTGQTLAIREWAGLWESGERYRPGERVLLFLYPPSKLGLTSPVQGPVGRFRIGSDGQVFVDPRRISFRPPSPGVRNGLGGRTRVSPRELVRFFRSAEKE